MKTQFHGVFTAIVTPFNTQQQIDWAAYEELVERQVHAGVSGIVVSGTTGESPTLSSEEQLQLFANTVRWVNDRCAVIAGTGSNNTAHAVELSHAADALGVDAVLVVTPYYNKPTQEGIYRHFCAVAAATSTPIVVYNIKGRTGVNIETTTLKRLWTDCSNISAVKDSSGDIEQIKSVIEQCPDHFSVLSGDDDITFELIKAGGDGVVSVASNVMPSELCTMVSSALQKDFDKAHALHTQYLPFFKALFIETNPIPVKAVVAMQGLCKEVYRLPMCEMRPENRKKLELIARELKVI